MCIKSRETSDELCIWDHSRWMEVDMMWFDIWWKRRQRRTGLYQSQYFGCSDFESRRLAKLKTLFEHVVWGGVSLTICEDIAEFIRVILLLNQHPKIALDGLSFLPARNEDNDQCTVQHCAAFQGAICGECWMLYCQVRNMNEVGK